MGSTAPSCVETHPAAPLRAAPLLQKQLLGKLRTPAGACRFIPEESASRRLHTLTRSSDSCLSDQITTCTRACSGADPTASFLEKLQCFWLTENTIENKHGVQMYGQCRAGWGGSRIPPISANIPGDSALNIITGK